MRVAVALISARNLALLLESHVAILVPNLVLLPANRADPEDIVDTVAVAVADMVVEADMTPAGILAIAMSTVVVVAVVVAAAISTKAYGTSSER